MDLGSYTVGRTLDIGEAGIGALLVDDWIVGTSVCLEFPVPILDVSLKIRGVFRHRAGMRYGLEFIDLSSTESSAIRKTCENLKSLD